MKLRLIKIGRAESFGIDRYRPDCSVSATFAELLGRRTFEERHLILIRKLGFEIEIYEGGSK